MQTYTLKLTLTEPLLGTASRDGYGDRAVETGAPAENVDEELETIPEPAHQMTVFCRLPDGRPSLWDYSLKGYFKDAAGMLRRVKGTESSKITAYKKVVDGLVFVKPRQIPLVLPPGGELGLLERPLRAQTAKGERVAIARSETCPAGTTLEMQVNVLGGDVTEILLREWLDYGALRGLGQWRNGGYGVFQYELTRRE